MFYNIIWDKIYKCFTIKEGKSKYKRAYYSTTDKKDAEDYLKLLNS